MNTMTTIRRTLDQYALSLLLMLFSSASIGFGLAWSLHAAIQSLA